MESTDAPADRSFGEMYPWLLSMSEMAIDDEAASWVFDLPDGDSVFTWLFKNGVHTFANVAALTDRDIRSWPGIGEGKAGRIDAVFAHAAKRAGRAGRSAAEEDSRPSDRDSQEPDSPPGEFPLDPDEEMLTSWAKFARGATSVGEALVAIAEDELPQDVAEALGRIRSRSLPEVSLADPIALVAEWVAGLGPREYDILRGRVVAFEPRTLDDIAKPHGLTRERIRQLEKRLIDRLNEQAQAPDWREVRWAIYQLQQGLGNYAPVTEVPLVDASGEPSYEFGILLWLAGYEQPKGDSVLRAKNFALPRVEDVPLLDEGPLVDEPSLTGQLKATGVHARHVDFAISAIRGLDRVGDVLVTWPSTAPNKAAVVLAVRQRPMTVEELVEAIGGTVARGSVANGVRGHAEMIRVSKTHIGLRSFGMDEYGGVAESMVQILEAEGPQELTGLQDRMVSRFGVSPNSVAIYANAPRFILRNGVVDLRGPDEPYAPRHHPESVPGLYLRDRDTLNWHIDVDRDLARGSGRALPPEIAVFLGVAPGQDLTLTASARTVPVTWSLTSSSGPAIGSLRSVATDAGADVGDTLRLKFSRQTRQLEAERVGPVADKAQDRDAAIKQLSQLTGLPEDTWHSNAATAAALQCDPAEVERVLRDRGDTEIADLVVESRGS